MYKALYRQYRPMTFDDVFGQDTIVKTLRNSIKNSSFGHAYIFFGPRGTGKTSISKIFARSVNCLNPINGNSCGKCNNCLKSYEKECVDIIEIDAASNNGVDEIRELINKVSLVPAELKYKVYIIDEVHMLSIGAFNALLKTLEEPPQHVIFILATTDPQKVPETIISRCQCFSFKRISTENIVLNLKQICEKENIDIDNDVIEEIACSCDGGMRDALSSLDQLRSYSESKITIGDYAAVNASLTEGEINKFYSAIFNCNYVEVLSLIKKYNSEEKNLINILEKLMRTMRNEIVEFYSNGKNPQFDVDLILKLVLKINEKIIDIKKSSNPVIYIEMFLLEFMNNIKMNSQAINSFNVNDDTTKLFKINEQNLEESSQNVENKDKNDKFNEEKKSERILRNDNIIEFNKQNENENVEKTFYPQEKNKKVKNISEIIDVRVNNTLAKANKQILLREISNLDLFKDYTFDQEIGYIACSILDSKIRAASDENIILSYEYDSIVKQNIEILDKLTSVYNSITNSNKKIAIISDKKWEEIKNRYILDKKNGIIWNVLPEPEEIFEEETKNGIINSSAIELFGDIVEIK